MFKKQIYTLARTVLAPFYATWHNWYNDWLYHSWLKSSVADSDERVKSQYDPYISVVVPTYNTDEGHFIEMVDSVLMQTYSNWELIIVDDCSTDSKVRNLIKEVALKDSRIRYQFLDENLGISEATNTAIRLSSGEFIALFDHDDVLSSIALEEVAYAIAEGDYDFVYTDEDKLTNGSRGRHQPFLKPGWNFDLLRSINYITHFAVIRKSLLNQAGYEDSRYNGAQDWELFLRCTRELPAEKIHHIPKVLYSWRVHQGSTAQDLGAKPYVQEAQQRAIEDDLNARSIQDARVFVKEKYPSQWLIDWTIRNEPKVVIAVCSPAGKDAVKNIVDHTSYINYEIMQVNEDIQAFISETKGEFIVFVEDKVEIRNTNWIQAMLGDARRSEMAFVQARLSNPNKVAKNIENLLGPNRFKIINKLTKRNVSKHLYLTTRYNLPIIYGGVTMIESKKLRLVTLSKPFAGVSDASSSLSRLGYTNLYNPYVEVLK